MTKKRKWETITGSQKGTPSEGRLLTKGPDAAKGGHNSGGESRAVGGGDL